jgi:glycogen operon protein
MRRGIISTLLLSQGTPMILMGDEVGRSQNGNNNAYCQDNEIAWLEWKDVSESDHAFMEFMRGVIRMRKRYRILRANHFLHGEPVDEKGTRSVVWFRPDGQEMDTASWGDGNARVIGMLLSDNATRLLVLLSAYHQPIQFTLPTSDVRAWTVRIDSGSGEIDPADRRYAPGATIELPGRMLLFLAGETG